MSLKRLILTPRAGLCNKLRAIAAGKRVCAKTGAELTVVWPWGRYDDYFTDSIKTVTTEPVESREWLHLMQDATTEGAYARSIPIDVENLCLNTAYAFNLVGEPATPVESLLPWLPRPSIEVQTKVNDFASQHFQTPTVGLHMRRSDHGPAKSFSPDGLFFEQLDPLVGQGYNVFLATDTRDVETIVRNRYKKRVVTYPKNPEIAMRWPRKAFSHEEVFDDVMDLFLLAATDFLFGSAYSSYSRVATTYNGNPKCKLLGTKDPRKVWADVAEETRKKKAAKLKSS